MSDAKKRLFVMRHGQADPGVPDEARPLSSQGQREATLMATWLDARLGVAGKAGCRLVSSPLSRARQTADRVGSVIGGSVEVISGLTPEDSPQALGDWLLEQEGDVIMVSHMPLVGRLTGWLTGDRSGGEPHFATAAIAELTADIWIAGCADLRLLLSPSELAGR